MFDRVSNQEVKIAIDTLIAILGVKEEVSLNDLRRLLSKGDVQGCIQKIASHLGLPVHIDLSYVPKNASPDSVDRFESTYLAQTDSKGRGIEGVSAQVSIPQHLPMFGTAELNGYTIRVRVSKDCQRHANTFIAVMLHELSHVLLAALLSPHKNSELHTDLVPVILGFRKTVRRGRKVVESRSTTRVEKITTTTFGYLTDTQFDFACSHVTNLLEGYSKMKTDLQKATFRIEKEARKASAEFHRFLVYFNYLNKNPPKRMTPEHARRVVEMHSNNHISRWQQDMTNIMSTVESAKSFISQLNKHYYPTTVNSIGLHLTKHESFVSQLRLIKNEIRFENQTIYRYVPLTYRLRTVLFRNQLPKV